MGVISAMTINLAHSTYAFFSFMYTARLLFTRCPFLCMVFPLFLYTMRFISTCLFSQSPHHVMASEVQYVNCQELHNPTFTSRIASARSDVSSDGQGQQLEAASIPGVVLVAPSMNLSPLEEALEDHVSHLRIGQKGQNEISSERQSPQLEAANGHCIEPTVSSVILAPSVEVCPSPASHTEKPSESHSEAVLSASPAIPVLPTRISQSPVLQLKTVPEEQIDSRSGGQDGNSLQTLEAEHTAAVVGSEFIPKLEEPSVSDQDDDVQFILSVTRKRRKKRHNQDHLSSNPGQGASVLAEITAGENSRQIVCSGNLGLQTGNMSSLGFTAPPKPSHSLPAMPHTCSDSSFTLHGSRLSACHRLFFADSNS